MPTVRAYVDTAKTRTAQALSEMHFTLLEQAEVEGGKEMNPITIMIILLAICLVLSSACLGLVIYLLVHIRKTGGKKP